MNQKFTLAYLLKILVYTLLQHEFFKNLNDAALT